MKIGHHEISPSTVLAPMAAITNPPFRQLCLEHGAGLAGSEMLSAAQVVLAPERVPIERCPNEPILVVQLYGRIPAQMAEAARIVADRGADVVDINLGCPARKVVHQGAGVSLMCEPDLAELIADQVARAVSVPVTAKMRAGFSVENQNAAQIAKRVTRAGAQAVTIHARTREGVHTGPLYWDSISQVRDVLPPEITVIGNGGITGPEEAQKLRDKTGCDGIMIGRATRGRPWIFRELEEKDWPPPSGRELARVINRHLDLYIAWAGEEQALREMRKHLCWYARGFPYAAKMRGQLARITSKAAATELIEQYVVGS